jgi:hypothetical protein
LRFFRGFLLSTSSRSCKKKKHVQTEREKKYVCHHFPARSCAESGCGTAHENAAVPCFCMIAVSAIETDALCTVTRVTGREQWLDFVGTPS